MIKSNGYSSWMGELYAVVFAQGTVKVGMSLRDSSYRHSAHALLGTRFGVDTAYVIVCQFKTKDVPYREAVLCNMCKSVATPASGYEWFRFDDAESAKTHILGFMDRIKRDDFEGYTQRTSALDEEYARTVFAKAKVREGIDLITVHTLSGIPVKKLARYKERKKIIVSDSEHLEGAAP